MAKKSSRTSKSNSTPAKKGVPLDGAKKLVQQTQELQMRTMRLKRTSKQLHREIEHDPKNARSRNTRKAARNFPIVGIGASAGGLEAVTQLLNSLPADTGMAFVLVQHLDPTHKSALSELLGRATKMPVAEARNNTVLEPNHVYVIPPNKGMRFLEGRLKLSPRSAGTENMPIDDFFQSLAEESNSVVGIVLSGNGVDGTQGLLAIKAAGGITFAQDEKSAKFSGMPSSAAAAGCVDFVLSPEKMVRELKRISGHLATASTSNEANHLPVEEKAFEDILTLVRHRTGVDFTFYKHATLRRRMQRRMVLHKFESLKDYGNYLRSHAAEV